MRTGGTAAFFFFFNYSWEMALLKELVLVLFSVQFSDITLELWIKIQTLVVCLKFDTGRKGGRRERRKEDLPYIHSSLFFILG